MVKYFHFLAFTLYFFVPFLAVFLLILGSFLTKLQRYPVYWIFCYLEWTMSFYRSSVYKRGRYLAIFLSLYYYNFRIPGWCPCNSLQDGAPCQFYSQNSSPYELENFFVAKSSSWIIYWLTVLSYPTYFDTSVCLYVQGTFNCFLGWDFTWGCLYPRDLSVGLIDWLIENLMLVS